MALLQKFQFLHLFSFDFFYISTSTCRKISSNNRESFRETSETSSNLVFLFSGECAAGRACSHPAKFFLRWFAQENNPY